ncbi:MoaF C-terminal domain-containing protein [Bradyrhizobium sp. 14AA]
MRCTVRSDGFEVWIRLKPIAGCLKGVRRGDCGKHDASYWKIRDDVYLVTWREILINLAAAFRLRHESVPEYWLSIR